MRGVCLSIALFLVACIKGPSTPPTSGSGSTKAVTSSKQAPGGSITEVASGQPVELASLYKDHCAVVTFYRGFF